MAINNPMTSSSQWRIPEMRVEQPHARVAQLSTEETRPGSIELATEQALALGQAAARKVIAGLLVGGVLVAPILAVAAIVSLVAPMPLSLRHMAPAMTFIALIWLALAIFGAHTQVERPTETASTDNHDALN